MGKVKVKYLNIYSNLTGRKEEFIAFDQDLTLGALVHRVAQSGGPKFRDAIMDESKTVKPYVWILVNREHVKDLDRALKEGDTVVFGLPPVGG